MKNLTYFFFKNLQTNKQKIFIYYLIVSYLLPIKTIWTHYEKNVENILSTLKPTVDWSLATQKHIFTRLDICKFSLKEKIVLEDF